MYPEKLEIHVYDRGKGFDVQRVVPDVTTPEHLFDMRGAASSSCVRAATT